MDQLDDDIFDDDDVAARKNKSRPTGKFQPKAKPKLPKKTSTSSIAVQVNDTELTEPQKNGEPSDNCFVAFNTILHTIDSNAVTGGLVPPPESVPVDVLDNVNIGLGSNVPVDGSTNTNNASQLEEGNPVTAGSRSGDGISMTSIECERGETDVMDSMVLSQLATLPAQRSGKHQPKAKIQTRNSRRLSSTKSVSSPPHSPQVNLTQKNFLHDDVQNVSSIGLTDGPPIEETPELPVNEQTAQLDSGSHLEGVPEIPAKLVSRRAKKGKYEAHTASDLPLHQNNASSSGKEKETGRSLRPRTRKVSFVELDEAEVVAATNDLSEDVPYIPAVEDNDQDEQIQLESEPKAKKTRVKKSTKANGNKEKPAKKRKKDKEISAQVADSKPKKFSHSTKRRQVDQSLINMDPELLDMGTLCIRDVIRLGEHWERQTKKEQAAAKPTIKPSNENSSSVYNEEDAPFTYRDGEEDNDEQENPVIEESSLLINYHTYMDRTPTVRWSKQDTELFYEGVSQFGADLSMIQQLFPSRTRHQIKLKYKKEEKQHPLRLRDALTNRTKNLSHYMLLIERLKKMAEEEEQNAEKDESIDLTGEEVAEEGTSHADDEEAAEKEQIEEEGKDDVVGENGDPVEETYDSEDDMVLWSQYKSDL